jgi:hypothetical protein
MNTGSEMISGLRLGTQTGKPNSDRFEEKSSGDIAATWTAAMIRKRSGPIRRARRRRRGSDFIASMRQAYCVWCYAEPDSRDLPRA